MQSNLGCPPGPSPFSHLKKIRGERGCQLRSETQPVSLLSHNSSTVYVHPITLSHLQDWWCKQLEGMEHIRTEHIQRSSHTFTSLGWVPNGKNKKKGLEPVLEEEQRSFLWYGLGSFGCFMAFNLPQSFVAGPGVKSEDRYMGDSCQDFRGWLQFLPCFEF